MNNPLLSVRNLSKAYGALAVTDDVSLDVAPNSIHAIIGPNGAGKTTLIKQLAGGLISDRGTVTFKGEDITVLDMARRVRRGLARSFQITSVLGGFSVLENVALAVQARSGSSFRFFRPASLEAAINAEAMDCLERVHLDERASFVAGSLSHGEKRQLEIAIAYATGADMLLLDEPLAGSSHKEADVLVRLIASLKASHSVILIEHDMNAVFSLADELSVLVYGRIIASGLPEHVRSLPEVRSAYLGDED